MFEVVLPDLRAVLNGRGSDAKNSVILFRYSGKLSMFIHIYNLNYYFLERSG